MWYKVIMYEMTLKKQIVFSTEIEETTITQGPWG